MADRDLRELERRFVVTGTLRDYAPLLRERHRRGRDPESTTRSTRLLWKQFKAVRFYDPDRLSIQIPRGHMRIDYWYPAGGTTLMVNQVYDGHALRRLYASTVDRWGDTMTMPTPGVVA